MVLYATNDGKDSPVNKAGLDEETKKYHLDLYETFMGFIPSFSDLIISLQDETDALQALISILSSAAGEARAEDTSSIKTHMPTYLLKDPTQDVILPPISRLSKDCRGFHHEATARMLCPMRFLKKFDRDPQLFMEWVNNGKIKIMSLDYASWMYDVEMYDPEEIDKGLLRGYFLLRAYRHIFSGPTSALSPTENRGTRNSKGIIHRLTCPTPRTIAYAAIQARLALSAAPKWSVIDGNFSLEELFYNIVGLFEDDPKDTWAVETLEWWKKQVPRLSENAKRTSDDLEISELEYEESDIATLERQRAARRRRLQETLDQERTPSRPSPTDLDVHHGQFPGSDNGHDDDDDDNDPMAKPSTSSLVQHQCGSRTGAMSPKSPANRSQQRPRVTLTISPPPQIRGPPLESTTPGNSSAPLIPRPRPKPRFNHKS